MQNSVAFVASRLMEDAPLITMPKSRSSIIKAGFIKLCPLVRGLTRKTMLQTSGYYADLFLVKHEFPIDGILI